VLTFDRDADKILRIENETQMKKVKRTKNGREKSFLLILPLTHRFSMKIELSLDDFYL
jgi:hypothetical protein